MFTQKLAHVGHGCVLILDITMMSANISKRKACFCAHSCTLNMQLLRQVHPAELFGSVVKKEWSFYVATKNIMHDLPVF